MTGVTGKLIWRYLLAGSARANTHVGGTTMEYAQIATTAVCTAKALIATALIVATVVVEYYRINRYGVRV